MEAVLIVPLGGSCVFALVFCFYVVMLATDDFCVGAMTYLVENTVEITIVLGIISLVVAIIALAVSKKAKWGFASFVLVMHFLCCSAYGIYGTIKASDNSFLLLLWGGVIYLAITLVHAIISGYLALFCAETDKPGFIYPVAIGLSTFLYFFY